MFLSPAENRGCRPKERHRSSRIRLSVRMPHGRAISQRSLPMIASCVLVSPEGPLLELLPSIYLAAAVSRNGPSQTPESMAIRTPLGQCGFSCIAPAGHTLRTKQQTASRQNPFFLLKSPVQTRIHPPCPRKSYKPSSKRQDHSAGYNYKPGVGRLAFQFAGSLP